MEENVPAPCRPGGKIPRRGLEIAVGALLLLYVAAILVSVNARMSATEDLVLRLPVTHQGEEEIEFETHGDRADQFIRYGARLLSGILMVAISALAYRIFAPYEPTLALAGTLFLSVSAVFACLAAMTGLALGQGFTGQVLSEGGFREIDGAREFYTALVPLLVLSEKIWLTFAALGAVAYGGLVAWEGSLPRWLGLLGIASGLFLLVAWAESIGRMPLHWDRPQLVWVPTLSVLNQLVGIPALVWLLLSSGWLIARGADRPSPAKH